MENRIRPKAAHLAQSARPLCLTGGSHLSAQPRAPPLSLSLCPVGQPCWCCCSRPCALSPSLCSAIPTCQPSSTSCPRSPRRGRAHVRAFSAHVPMSSPLLSPAPCSPTSPRSFAPSAKPPRPLSRSAHACRELRHRPRRLLPVQRPPPRPRPV